MKYIFGFLLMKPNFDYNYIFPFRMIWYKKIIIRYVEKLQSASKVSNSNENFSIYSIFNLAGYWINLYVRTEKSFRNIVNLNEIWIVITLFR